jgi:hypothetical protein
MDRNPRRFIRLAIRKSPSSYTLHFDFYTPWNSGDAILASNDGCLFRPSSFKK